MKEQKLISGKLLSLFWVICVIATTASCDMFKGEQGIPGEVGAIGPQGPVGSQGPQGIPGLPGETGAAGPIGLTGAAGQEGTAGPVGPAGPKGDKGDKGDTGNGNVTLYTFGQVDFRNAWTTTLLIPLSTGEVRERVLLLPYLVGASEDIYPVPGRGKNPNSEYRSILFNPTKASSISMRIDKVGGDGELYTGIRVFKIVANSTVNRRIQLPDIDLEDYNAVAEYYGFKD